MVGEIVDDDASKGAAIGATVGAIGARRNARKAEKAEQASAEQAAEKTAAASEQQMGNFKKASLPAWKVRIIRSSTRKKIKKRRYLLLHEYNQPMYRYTTPGF